MSIVELLVSIVIIGVAVAGLTETLWLNALWSYRLGNKLDNIYAARRFIQRVSKDLRMASNVGDALAASTSPPGFGSPSLTFPSPSNPYYSSWTSDYYSLAYPNPQPGVASIIQQLIIQVPVYDGSGSPGWTGATGSSGFPSMIPAGTGSPSCSPVVLQNALNVDTICYQVVTDPDPHAPGPWMLQVEVFPAKSQAPALVASTRTAITPPQTLLRGITGPLDPTTLQPKVFEYIDRYELASSLPGAPPENDYTVDGTVSDQEIGQISAVRINLEIQHETFGTTNTSGGLQQAAMMGFQTTVFLRNTLLPY